jgi:hypothetical protein
VKALVLNALGRGFDFEDVEIAAPIRREVLVNVQASGLCHTDRLFSTHDIVPHPLCWAARYQGSWQQSVPISQIRAGRVVINGMTDDPQAPWGGFKCSGVGREYGLYGMEAFLETRAIHKP